MSVSLKVKTKRGTFIGLDLATKTGYAVIKDHKLVHYGSVALDRSLSHVNRLDYTASFISNTCSKYFNSDTLIIIEDCFLKLFRNKKGNFNANVLSFKFLTRLSGYLMSYLLLKHSLKLNNFVLVYPTASRKKVGVVGRCDKKRIVEFVNSHILSKPVFKLTHHNICDAVVLALYKSIIRR